MTAGPSLPPVYETIGALRDSLVAYDKQRAAQRLQDAALRGALAGVTVRGGLHLVTFLLHLLPSGKKRRPADRPDAALMLRDTARWGAFLGTFSGSFVFFEELFHCCVGDRRSRAWRAMAAGALAGPSLLLAGTQQTHTSLALYVLIRGATLLVRCGNLPGAHPLKRRLLAPTRWKHGAEALMCLSSSQLAYSWIVLPQTLPPSFVRFLNKHGGKQMHVYHGLREISSRGAAGLPPAPLAALAGTELAGVCGATSCGFVHPGQACAAHAARFFPEAYLRALPVYFPVYLLPAILVHRKKLLAADAAPELWRKLGLGVLRSSLFLSLFCTLAWSSVCAGFSVTGRTTGAVIASSVWMAGLSVLVEKKSRRMELALYCLSRAAESFALCTVAWGWVRPGALPRRLDVLLFSLASASILHCYSDHLGERRCVFRSSYLRVFDFILGNSGIDKASISHHPSNAALVMRGVRSVRSFGNLLARGGSGPGGANGSGLSRGSSGAGPSPALSPHASPQPGSSPAQGAAAAGAARAAAAEAGGDADAPVAAATAVAAAVLDESDVG